MTKTIKAIETQYKGYRFRSRLEARWAVFFDALGIEWEYEPEGYDLGEAGWYLPDFWLPGLKMWVEVKAMLQWEEKGERWKYQSSAELELCKAFRNKQSWPIACFVGVPGEERIYWFGWDFTSSSGGSCDADNAIWCFSNGIYTIHPNLGRRDREYISDNLCGIDMEWFEFPNDYGFSVNEIFPAYTAARSARFEHGESPR